MVKIAGRVKTLSYPISLFTFWPSFHSICSIFRYTPTSVTLNTQIVGSKSVRVVRCLLYCKHWNGWSLSVPKLKDKCLPQFEMAKLVEVCFFCVNASVFIRELLSWNWYLGNIGIEWATDLRNFSHFFGNSSWSPQTVFL